MILKLHIKRVNFRKLSIISIIILVTILLFLSINETSENLSSNDWEQASPEDVGMNTSKLKEARDYAGGAGFIIRGGKVVMRWGDVTRRYALKSTTKSIGVTALGLGVKDNIIQLDDKAQQYYPNLGLPPNNNNNNGWLDDITIFHLGTHTAGFDKAGGYTSLLFEPGTAWAYSDSGANWLADCITVAYGRDVQSLLFERVFNPLGISPSTLTWRDHIYREDTINGIKRREFASGISASVDAMARIGYLYLRNGQWNGQQIISESFVNKVRTTVPKVARLRVVNDTKSRFEGASRHYGILWWNNADGSIANVPKDAYWSWGLNENLILIIPSLDIVVSRAGPSWTGPKKPNFYKVLEPFLKPIVASINLDAPYSHSPAITSITWADSSATIREARGSDNWPITWADDDKLYTAYGDGYGFDPRLSTKLSLGFARVGGMPPNFVGLNIRSETGEQKGDGKRGKKVSGMLMVDGTLYMWVRNADKNGKKSQLAWSNDYAKTWTWNEWQFAEFGYPCFLNFGKNYSGARDGYVYVYSPDTPSAYNESDRVVLMRVSKEEITHQSSYEFLKGVDAQGNPFWTKDITQRGAVFTFRGGCNRIDVVYNTGIGRYLMTMRSRAKARGKSQFSIYDAPEPWGPWTTVYYEKAPFNEDWGESQHIPSKWISADGKTFYLVYSGDDSFSVRRATLTVSAPEDTTPPQGLPVSTLSQ